ncbi:MAG: hypothetical protein ACR2G5_00825 [Pyrinomonadaceae bacterium]
MGFVIKLRRNSFAGICLVVCGIVVCCQESAKAHQTSQTLLQNREKAEELWEQAIAAKGGRERLLQVSSLLIFYQISFRVSSKRSTKLHESRILVTFRVISWIVLPDLL